MLNELLNPATTAVIIVDMQNDFLPGGALSVAGGLNIIPNVIALASMGCTVVKTRDAHPANHCSFTVNGGIWPVHCVDGSFGSDLHSQIAALQGVVFKKATSHDKDAYSGFEGTGLADYLRSLSIKTVIVVGVATDYCVKATALDAVKEGFETLLPLDAVAAVDEDGAAEVLSDLMDADVQLTYTQELLDEVASR